MKKRICSTVCVIFVLLGILLTSTCCVYDKTVGIEGAEINDIGELILKYTDGSEQNLGKVVGDDGSDGKDGSDGSVTIGGEAEGVLAASSKGLRSTVSVVCNFKATVIQGGWRPGSGSTTTKSYSSAGSGVIYKLDKNEGDAFIITNYHVVYDVSSDTENGISDDISVYLYGAEFDKAAIKATYVGGSMYYDIAVLRVEDSEMLKDSNALAVEVQDSESVSVGENAIAIGNAKGYGISVSLGIVSVDTEYITMTAADEKTAVYFRVMRVDTAVNPGNSGGGLYNGKGELIGIVNAKIVDSGVENIAYAIPSSVATSVADNVIELCFEKDNERVIRAVFGAAVNIIESRAEYNAENMTVSIKEKVMVTEVTEGSMSDGVLEVGDVILYAELNGEVIEVTRQHHIVELMIRVREGDTLNVTVLRSGEEMTVSLEVTAECLTEY